MSNLLTMSEFLNKFQNKFKHSTFKNSIKERTRFLELVDKYIKITNFRKKNKREFIELIFYINFSGIKIEKIDGDLFASKSMDTQGKQERAFSSFNSLFFNLNRYVKTGNLELLLKDKNKENALLLKTIIDCFTKLVIPLNNKNNRNLSSLDCQKYAILQIMGDERNYGQSFLFNFLKFKLKDKSLTSDITKQLFIKTLEIENLKL